MPLRRIRRWLRLLPSFAAPRWRLADGAPAAPLRLWLICPAVDATQAIFFLNPFASLRQAGLVTFHALEEAAFESRSSSRLTAWLNGQYAALRPHALIISRYGGRHGEALAAFARAHGLPVLAHLDDDLFDVPREAGPAKRRYYMRPARLRRRAALLTGAGAVYASTPELAARLARRLPGAKVHAGRIPCSAGRLRPPPAVGEEGLTIGYMGSTSHGPDLAIAAPALARLMAEYPALRFELFGGLALPPALRPFAGRCRVIPPVAPYGAFVDALHGLGWHIGIAPLADTPFNAAKIPIKWVEYSAAGMAVAASDTAVYRKVCAGGRGLLCGDGGWYQALKSLLDRPETLAPMVAAAQSLLQREYTHSRLAKQTLHMLAQAGVDVPAAVDETLNPAER